MGKTPRELLACVTSADITEMMAFEQLEPFGALADEYRTGQVAATVANVHRDAEQRPEPWQPHDFMPGLEAARALAQQHAQPATPRRGRALVRLLDRAIFGR